MDTQFSIKQTTMCCHQFNNIKWRSSKKWRTPRVSVRVPPIPHISDINYEIADSTVLCFADDTRILLGIKDEEDTQLLQNDLHKLYKFADTNNMKFNANKFELMRYGKEQEIKSATTYKWYDDSNINGKEQVRDLGIMMSNTATFTLRIRNIV